jgi:hypothetical protein
VSREAIMEAIDVINDQFVASLPQLELA